MNRKLVALGLSFIVGQQAFAAGSNDPLYWLEKMASAGQQFNYSGTFVYQSGATLETSRVVHFIDENGKHERIEMLDGSPRELIRNNQEVRCFFTDSKTVLINTLNGRESLLDWTASSSADLGQNYQIKLGEKDRVAGLEVQSLNLVAKDDLRYDHTLWAEEKSGLLLKARRADASGAIIEQFSFSHIEIGMPLQDTFPDGEVADYEQWQVIEANVTTISAQESGWTLNADLPGYQLKSVMRLASTEDQEDTIHYVYSDGLASISVFIQPLAQVELAEEFKKNLPVKEATIYRRRVDDFLITVLGEAPYEALRRLGDGVVPVESASSPSKGKDALP